jgi:hypothetical protein
MDLEVKPIEKHLWLTQGARITYYIDNQWFSGTNYMDGLPLRSTTNGSS